MASAESLGRLELELWTTHAVVLTTDHAAIDRVRSEVLAELGRIELACSRFRADSEVSRIARRPGVPFMVSPVLAELLNEAKRAEEWTGGAVSVTVGADVQRLGYDKRWAGLTTGPSAARAPWAPLGYDAIVGTYVGAPGEVLDFGSIGKAIAADRIAALIAERAGCGVLVNLGGDIAIAGRAPVGGWRISIDDDLSSRPTVALREGALATSSTLRRSWRTEDGVARHHIVDPRTGENPAPYWACVSVAAARAVDANAAATASIVLGDRAPRFLAAQGMCARLTAIDGRREYVGGWPEDTIAAA